MKIVQCALLLCAAAAFGCGQKGPLVLPDAPKHKPMIPAQTAKPASDSAPPAPSVGAPVPAAPSNAPTDSPAHP